METNQNHIKGSNINIVIIGQNEGVHISNMCTSLSTLLPLAKRIWILDRCTDDSEKQLLVLGETYFKTKSKLKGRQTSYCRNLGLSKCDSNKDILFLDGDRFPKAGTLQQLTTWPHDIALLLIEWDNRIYTEFTEKYGTVMNDFFSCGVYFKREAINKILTFQKGKLFNEKIQQHWGIEDTYLGDVCYHLGLTCNLYFYVRLQGKFARTKVDGLDVVKERFKLRQKLDVKW